MSLVTLACSLMLSPKARLCFWFDLREGNLGSYPRNYSLVDLHNEAPSGGECIEQPRTNISRIRAFISLISKSLLKVPLLNYQKRERKKSLMVLSSWFSMRPCLKGLRKEWLEWEDHSLCLICFNHNFLEEVPLESASCSHVKGNIRGVFTKEYALTLTTIS